MQQGREGTATTGCLQIRIPECRGLLKDKEQGKQKAGGLCRHSTSDDYVYQSLLLDTQWQGNRKALTKTETVCVICWSIRIFFEPLICWWLSSNIHQAFLVLEQFWRGYKIDGVLPYDYYYYPRLPTTTSKPGHRQHSKQSKTIDLYNGATRTWFGDDGLSFLMFGLSTCIWVWVTLGQGCKRSFHMGLTPFLFTMTQTFSLLPWHDLCWEVVACANRVQTLAILGPFLESSMWRPLLPIQTSWYSSRIRHSSAGLAALPSPAPMTSSLAEIVSAHPPQQACCPIAAIGLNFMGSLGAMCISKTLQAARYTAILAESRCVS